MNQLQTFSSSEFGEIRTTLMNSEPMFCLADVCKVLDIKNVSDCKSRLMSKGVATTDTLTKGGKQKMTFINEANLYKVIFQSRKESAERFTDWVTSEVLPSIRKTGGYIHGQDELSDAELMAKALMVAQRQIDEKNNRIAEMRPKEIFADAVSASNSSILIGDLAKLIKQNGHDIGQRRLFEWMREKGYLMKTGSSRNLPTQRSMDMGLFEIKESTVINPDGSNRLTKTTKVTGKGQVYFINKFIA